MGKKLDALFGRSFKPSKFKSLLNLAISRLPILKNQHHSRCSMARTDAIQLLHLGHQDRALSRVEQVIKEQNMLDVLETIENYCHLLIERVNLLKHEKECPDELKEATSSLVYAASRCGDFPELQEIRAVITFLFGKEFAARAVQLRNTCGVNPKMIQKLSTRQPSMENRVKVLKEIASENNIVLQDEEEPFTKTIELQDKLEIGQKHSFPKQESSATSDHVNVGDSLQNSLDEMTKFDEFTDSLVSRRQYRDVAEAAQAAFESAAYAAAAARAAVEMSRSGSHDPDDHPSRPPRKIVSDDDHDEPTKFATSKEIVSKGIIQDPSVGQKLEKIIHPIQNSRAESSGDDDTHNDSETEESRQRKNMAKFERSNSASSSNSGDNVSITDKRKPIQTEIVSKESDEGSSRTPSRTRHD